MHRREISFEVGDFVMAWPEHLPKHSRKKLHARAMGPYQIIKKLGSNAYVLDLPDNLGISPTFNVDDLTLHRRTFEPRSLPFFGASASTQIPKLPTFPQSHWHWGCARWWVRVVFSWRFPSLLGTMGWPITIRCHLDYRRWVRELKPALLVVHSRQLAKVEFFSSGGLWCN